MKISLNWLNEYIDIKNENVKELQDKITRSGISVETIEKLCDATNLTVGLVLDVQKHPKADTLNVCQVNIKDEIVTIVCGAVNVVKNIKVVVSKVGAILPGGIEIKKSKIRDVESNGMICSLKELGLPSEKEGKEDIHILPNDAIIGDDPLKYLNADDTIFNLDLNPNRSDCLSIIGMAYETGAVLNKKVNKPIIKLNETNEKTEDYIKVSSKTDNCNLYIAKVVKNVVIKESPAFIQSRLLASGLRPINNVVDISNYVMVEYGQPLHFFDYDKLGNEIVVRMAYEKEKTTTLDNQKRVLNKEDIVVTNNKEIVAIAGVMGCLNTEVTKGTKNIVIESAIFNPYNVRYTSINNNLRSEASTRFERGLDPNQTLEALNRAAYLLQEYASGEVLSDISTHDKYNKNNKIIEIDLNKINNVLGMKLTKKEVLNIFDRLKFDTTIKEETFTVNVPTRRLDINIKEDLIEEIGRLYGYDNIIPTLPTGVTKRGMYSKIGKYRKTIIRHLQSLGLSQVTTYSLVSDNDLKKFTNDTFNEIKLLMPMSEDKKFMRYSLLPSLLNVVEYNLARNIKDIMIYETSTTYYQENDNYIEEEKVAGMLLGSYFNNNWQNKNIEVDFFLVKGILENLFEYLGLSGRYVFENNNIPKEFHPKQSAQIKIDNQEVGYFGVIHPSVNKNKIVIFELSLHKLIDFKIREIKYKEISKYPSISRDFSVLVNNKTKALDIIKTIQKTGGKILKNVEIFDLYKDEKIDQDKKSMAFNLIFQDENKTLTEEEVNLIFENVVNKVKLVYKGELRTK